MMGLFLGRAIAPAIMIALVTGVLAGVVVIWSRGVKAGRKTAVPFGPFLAFGAVVAVYAGQALIEAYLDSVH